MTSFCTSDLASLDKSLGVVRESLGKLKAAKSVDMPDVVEQVKRAANSASVIRESVWSELPDASWQTREELEALIAEIQKIFDARELERLRSRLLTLATELEHGTVVHRRTQRVTELNRLRDEAINELRAQARSEGAPQTLPGPQADQWIDWACGLREPQDAAALQTLRDGFPHLDDLVANLELDMWRAGQPPAPEVPPQPERASVKTAPEQSQMERKGFDRPAVSAEFSAGMKGGFDPRYVKVVDPRVEKRPQSQPQVAAPVETPAVHVEVPTQGNALASLDDSLNVLHDTLGKLGAALSVDVAEVVELLRRAAEYARIVRESVWAELPEASWETRKELDGLLLEIRRMVDARELERLRSRLLDLAAELERGTIVHRRAHRLNELNQLRDLAIKELRSQAGLEGSPQPLPGPPADQWIGWADALREPEDTEALQAIRQGFPRLDDFVANLEPNLWVAAKPPAPEISPSSQIPPEPAKPAGKTPPLQSRMEGKRVEEPVRASAAVAAAGAVLAPSAVLTELEEAKSEEEHEEPRFPELLDKLRRRRPRTYPPTEEEIQQIVAEERALLTGMMGSEVEEVEQHTTAPVERPVKVERPVFKEAPPVASVAPPAPEIAPVISTPVEKPLGEKLRKLVTTPAVLASAALLLLLAVLGAMLWGAHKNRTSISTVKTVEKSPDQTGNPANQGNGQSLMPTDSASAASTVQTSSATPAFSPTQTSSPKAEVTVATKPQEQKAATKPQEQKAAAKPPEQKATPKPKDQGNAAKPQNPSVPANQLAKASPPQPANLVSPPLPAPATTPPVKKEEAPPKVETPAPAPAAAPSAAPNSTGDIVKNIPVPVNTVVEQKDKVRVSSGVAQGLVIRQVAPQYPAVARQAHIQGTVVLQAVIGKDGNIQNLHVLSGNPMLTQAAMDAVKQWRYKPFRLNGEAVEADTEINVKFTLPNE
jgi:protein TonB